MSIQKHSIGLLYRRSLKWLKNFGLPFDLLCEESRKIRNEFEEYKNETDVAKIDFLVKRAEFWLDFYDHPSPYIIPTYPGGTSFVRYHESPPDWIARHSQIYNRDQERLKEWNEYKKKEEEKKSLH